MKINKLIGFLFFVLIINTIVLTGCSKGGKSFDNGIKAFEEGDYEGAAIEFSEAISLNPDRGDYFIAYGNTLLLIGSYEEAINVYNQVITDKDSKVVRENNKRAYYGKGIAYYDTNEYEKAIGQFDLALSVNELEDMNLDILLYKGDTQIIAGVYEEAKSTLTSAIDIDSNNSSVYFKRANVYKELKEYENSEADLDHAISKEPDFYEYYFAKFHLFEEQGKDKEAAEVLERITSIKVNDTEDIYNNAKANFHLGNYDFAKEGFFNSLKEGVFEANYYLASILEANEDYEGAVAYYEAFFDNPLDEYDIADYNIALAYNQMGYCLLQLEYFEKALESFNNGLELRVASLEQTLLLNKIVVLESLSDFNQAYEELLEYVAQYPDDEEALRELEFVKTRLPEVS